MSSFLLNAEIKLFSLKFKTWDFNSNQARYIFLALSLLAIIILKFIAIPLNHRFIYIRISFNEEISK